MEPITREEKYLAAMTGANITPPAPVTRHEMYLAAILNKLSEGATGGGTASEWSDLGEAVTNLGDTLTWDGNTEGKAETSIMGMSFYKVSDTPIPFGTDLSTAVMTVEFEGTEHSGAVTSFEDSGILCIQSDYGYVASVYDSATAGIPTGIYFFSGMTLTIPGYNFVGKVIKPIPEKYLPTATEITEASTDEQIPTAKAVFDHVKNNAGGGGDSNIVVVGFDFETMKLDHTPAEIYEMADSGKLVLLNMTGTTFTYEGNDGIVTEAHSTGMQGVYVNDGKVTIMYMKFSFNEAGELTGQTIFTVEGTAG